MIQEQRREALAPLRGNVLEVGFGTGLNLGVYPPQVTRLTALDSERMLPRRVDRRIAEARLHVELIKLDASGRLPFEDEAFDGVVTTFTLCSIREAGSALAEIRRVLKRGAPYVFLEHGRSDNQRVAKRQDFWNPVQRLIGCGCNMNRRIDQMIEAAGLSILELDRYHLPDTPRIMGEIYRGVAEKETGRL